MTKNPNPIILRHRLLAALFYWLWLPGLVIGSGLYLDRVLGFAPFLPGPIAKVAALMVLGLGIALIFRTERDLARLGCGTPSPMAPCRRLVTDGAFCLCRHPMSLGYDLAALAIVFFTGSPAMILVSYPLLLVWQVRALRREEEGLTRRFRDAYPVYRAKVPFLLPRLRPRPR